MASGVRMISWIPKSDDFYLVSEKEIHVYRIDQEKSPQSESSKKQADHQQRSIRIGPSSFASEIDVYHCNLSSIQSFAINPSRPSIVAAGCGTSDVFAIALRKDKRDKIEHPSFHVNPFVTRGFGCCFLSWSPSSPDVLVAGFEKTKGAGEPSVFVWDVSKSNAKASTPFESESKRSTFGQDNGIVAQCSPDNVVSGCFVGVNKFAVGCGTKTAKGIKLYDYARQNRNSAYQTITTDSIHGLAPFNTRETDPTYLIARTLGGTAFYNKDSSSIVVWDLRNTRKPVRVIHEPAGRITHAKWRLPHPRGDTAGIAVSYTCSTNITDSINIRYLHRDPDPDADQGGFIERQTHFKPKLYNNVKANSITSFDWHPSEPNRLLTVWDNQFVLQSQLLERLPICSNMRSDSLLISTGNGCVDMADVLNNCSEESKGKEMSIELMKSRLQRGYGSTSSDNSDVLCNRDIFNHYSKCCESDEKLSFAWRWLSHITSGSHNDTECESSLNFVKYPGVLAIANQINSTREEDVRVRDSKFKVRYLSEQRNRIENICKFADGFDQPNSRLSMLKLFDVDIKQAVNILTAEPANTVNKMAAVSIVGYQTVQSNDDGTLWRQTCEQLTTGMNDPYLKTMFKFLSCKLNSNTITNSFNDVISINSKLPITDKIRFAIRYFDDTSLISFLERELQHRIKGADLSGLILTGLGSRESVELLQSYVDATSDVQSAALFEMFGCFSNKLSSFQNAEKSVSLLTFLSSYRDILNHLHLWHARADLDIMARRITRDASVVPMTTKVSLICSYCNKPAISESKTKGKSSMNYPYSCMSCRKQLPRCSVCLRYMGLSATVAGTRMDPDKTPTTLNDVDSWFSWCQNCRHGGHAQHLIDWYKLHKQCPVTGCQCVCNGGDKTVYCSH